MNDDYDDALFAGIPSADPAIRTEYEAALGRFILAYNEADFRISKLIALELSESGHPELASAGAKGSFTQRLEKLEILQTATKSTQLSAIPVGQLRSINGDRNNLAHGHFDQNPYDGSYVVLQAAKARDYPIPRILKLAEELSTIVEALRTTEILYEFQDLTLKDGGAPNKGF